MKSRIRPTLFLVWPLLFGMFMIMVGNGLQGTLLSLRAEHEGFSISVIGIIMSLYYCGYLAGWWVVPPMIRSVGHIRVFAGFASLASTTILIQGLFVDPYVWSTVRMISGLSYVGLFIVAESWLNNIATNKLRAQTLSAYLCVVHGGLFTGQFLINIASIETMGLFVLVSVLISLSLLPVTLANKPTPVIEAQENLSLRKLLKTSPLSLVCVFASGFIGASMLTMGPLYAQLSGLSIPKISLFMALYIAGCATIPLLTGWISDNVDRRKMLIALTGISLMLSFVLELYPQGMMVFVFFLGGMTISIYGIAAAMMNDRLKPQQITSATASMILVSGGASCISPILIGLLMDNFGLQSFFLTYAVIFALALAFATLRHFIGPQISIEKQREFSPLPARSGPTIGQIAEISAVPKTSKNTKGRSINYD